MRTHIPILLLITLLLLFTSCSNPRRNSNSKRSRNTSSIEKSDKDKLSMQRAQAPKVEVVETVNNTIRKSLSSPELYEKCNNAVCMVYCGYEDGDISQGSAFFINSRGVAASNYHVFEGALVDEAYIKMTNGNLYKVTEVLSRSADMDFIVFKVNLNGGTVEYLKIADEEPKVGEKVVAIGSPKGLENTISEGIVSSYREHRNLIQISLPITHGSSGGPLMNIYGEVVGITTSGMGTADLNFAMNIQKLGIKNFVRYN